ncbi:hypothetical protein, partial [Prevotella nigrescens]|uniref:hypothetical protein n=1 Tax=Prevotella nigrescens TaxID=28133 RepID=UPI00242BE65F
DVEYSDKIIKYICENFEENKIFDITSDSNDKLKVLKNIIKKHSKSCNEELYLKLENKIYYYYFFDSQFTCRKVVPRFHETPPFYFLKSSTN